MGRSCSLRNSGRLFLRRSLRKSSRAMMTAVTTKADTRLARRGFGDGLWCKTVAGTQTHLFGKSAKLRLLEQGESATGAKYKASSGVQERPRCFHLRHLQEERARLAAPLCVWMLLGEDYFVNLALFYILWLKVTTTERRRLPVCLANGTRRGAQRGPIKPKARREFDILTPSRQLRGIHQPFSVKIW